MFLFIAALASCGNDKDTQSELGRYDFPDILDISFTPTEGSRNYGWFTDAGSWVGYTLPEQENWVNGFCGPFSLDMNRRQWLSHALVTASFEGAAHETFVADETIYYPGEAYIKATSNSGTITQTLNFIDASNALLIIKTDSEQPVHLTGHQWSEDVELSVNKNYVIGTYPSGEIVQITFPHDIELTATDGNYSAVSQVEKEGLPVVISFFTSDKELAAGTQAAQYLLNNHRAKLQENNERWDGYIRSVLRDDMEYAYDRIAVKAVTTLISNWRTHRGGLLHEGIVPSHAVNYFVGFWAWDTWRFAVAASKFHPELAKNNIRAMFDYQQEDGMIIDCIYTDIEENNARDSKPPLVSWAVNEIYEQTGDLSFVKEMYPQLVAYYEWWYNKRDIDKNGICEYGSTDGTLVAAAWESGMDNAIRFDDTKMLKDDNYDDAWSMDQESVDLNAYLAYENQLLQKFASLIGTEFPYEDQSERIRDYFFDEENNFFFDKRLSDGSFITEFGCEAYTPLWTKIATAEQVERMLPTLQDTAKFSTYIPFPTVAADNPKYNPKGYWRGPIWLDQTYFAIRGLRNYGYTEMADEYTLQVFERLDGLKNGGAIHENYGTHTGDKLKAAHFSWSAAHLLMMYHDYGKSL